MVQYSAVQQYQYHVQDIMFSKIPHTKDVKRFVRVISATTEWRIDTRRVSPDIYEISGDLNFRRRDWTNMSHTQEL